MLCSATRLWPHSYTAWDADVRLGRGPRRAEQGQGPGKGCGVTACTQLSASPLPALGTDGRRLSPPALPETVWLSLSHSGTQLEGLLASHNKLVAPTRTFSVIKIIHASHLPLFPFISQLFRTGEALFIGSPLRTKGKCNEGSEGRGRT